MAVPRFDARAFDSLAGGSYVRGHIAGSSLSRRSFMTKSNRWSMVGVGVCVVAGLGFAACNSTPTPSGQPAAAVDTRPVDEAAIRSADAAWTKSAEAKDVAAFAAMYADGGVV